MEGVGGGRRRMPSRACKKKTEVGPGPVAVKPEVKPEVEVTAAAAPSTTTKTPPPQVQQRAKKEKKSVMTAETTQDVKPKKSMLKKPSKAVTPLATMSDFEIGSRDKREFNGRLEWVKKHTNKQLTSTPLFAPSKGFSKKDVESCFGFDNDDDEENVGGGEPVAGSSRGFVDNEDDGHQISSIREDKGNSIGPIPFPALYESPLLADSGVKKDVLDVDRPLVRFGMLPFPGEKKGKKINTAKP